MAHKILVVENDDKEWDFLNELFNVRGDAAVRAKTAKEALELFKQSPDFNLVIIESLLPTRSGSELCLEIKETAEGRSVPVLLLGSIYKNFKLTQQAKFKFKADDVLIKPFSLDDLERKLALHLEGISLEEFQNLERGGRAIDAEAALPARIELSGSLDKIPLGRLLVWLAEHEETGQLRILSGETARNISFLKGTISFASYRNCGETLGQMLLRKGLINAEALTSSMLLMAEQNIRQGEALLQLGALTPHQLYDALSEHVSQIIIDLFAVRAGAYSFELRDDVSGAELALKIDLSRIVFSGIRRFHSPSALEEEFHDLGKLYAYQVKGGPFQLINLSLSAVEKRFCAGINGARSVAEILDQPEIGDFEARSLLLGLIFLGAIKLEMVPASEHPHPGGIPYGPPDRSKDARVNEYMDFIDTLHVRLRGSSETAALGLQGGESAEQIRESYLSTVSSLHDRKRYAAATAMARARADECLLKLHNAYLILGSKVPMELARRPIVADSRAPASKHNLVQGTIAHQQAMAYFDDKDYPRAHGGFIRAAQLDPLRGEYLAWAGWALFNSATSSGDKDQLEQARSLVQRSLVLDPNLSSGHLFMGLMAQQAGQLEQAEHHMECAADLNPDDPRILSALREIYRLTRVQTIPKPSDLVENAALDAYVSHIEAWYKAQSSKNLFELLGVAPDDPVEGGRRNYFDMAETIRPAKIYSNSPLLVQEMADEIFHRLTEAYETFSDPNRRSQYKLELEQALKQPNLGEQNQRRVEAERLRRRAQALFDNNDFRAAAPLFQRAHFQDRDDLNSLVRYGECLVRDFSGLGLSKSQAGQKAKAIMHEALNRDPSLAQAHAVLGRIYLDEHKTELAEKELDRTLEIDPHNIEALHSFRLLYSGLWRERNRQRNMAETQQLQELRNSLVESHARLFTSDFTRALEVPVDVSPDDLEQAFQAKLAALPDIANDTPERRDSVVRLFSERIGLRMAQARWLLSTPEGRAAVNQSLRSKEERDRFAKLSELSTARECLDIGWNALKTKDLDIAIKAFDRAARLAPGSGPAQALRAWCLWQTAPEGETGMVEREQALEQAKSAADIDPEAWETWYALALIQKERGNRKEAITWLQKAEKLDPKIPEVHRELTLLSSRSATDRIVLKDVLVDKLKGLFRRKTK